MDDLHDTVEKSKKLKDNGCNGQEFVSLITRSVSVSGLIILSLHIWGHYSAAASTVAGLMLFCSLVFWSVSTFGNYLLQRYKFNMSTVRFEEDVTVKLEREFNEFRLIFASRQPINCSCATISISLFYSMALGLNFISLDSLDLIAAVGAAAGLVDYLLFSSFRLYKKSDSIKYCISYAIGVVGISSAALVSAHLLTYSFMISTGAIFTLTADELYAVYSLGSIAALLIVPVFTLFLEIALDKLFDIPLQYPKVSLE